MRGPVGATACFLRPVDQHCVPEIISDSPVALLRADSSIVPDVNQAAEAVDRSLAVQLIAKFGTLTLFEGDVRVVAMNGAPRA